MKNQYLLAAILVLFHIHLSAQTYRFQEEQSPTYDEITRFFKQAAASLPGALYLEKGMTDAGLALPVFYIGDSLSKGRESIRILINNGIHPGEPDGIDASMILIQNLIAKKIRLPYNIYLCIIPLLNIEGNSNRSEYHRIGQNGPTIKAFRGNGKNLDLNRDFIKSESRNVQTLQEIFRDFDPHFFIDSHVSNGADYSYVMTLIDSDHSLLEPPLAVYANQTFFPELYRKMKSAGHEMFPYVNVFGRSPDKGMTAFLETPRYSSGYTYLHQCLSLVTETHMLKPYKIRVEATYQFLLNTIETASVQATATLQARAEARAFSLKRSYLPIQFKTDSSKMVNLRYKGYSTIDSLSPVTKKKQHYYDRERPVEINLPFYNSFVAVDSVSKPFAYVIPPAYFEIIDILKRNGIELHRLAADTILTCSVTQIDDFKTLTEPFEGHYLHYAIQTSAKDEWVALKKGDYLVLSNQEKVRFILETLEPRAPDSFFAWNFFDAILEIKEWFSDYDFDPRAAKILKEQPEIQQDFERFRMSPEGASASNYALLNWIRSHTQYAENEYRRYPVLRIERALDLRFY